MAKMAKAEGQSQIFVTCYAEYLCKTVFMLLFCMVLDTLYNTNMHLSRSTRVIVMLYMLIPYYMLPHQLRVINFVISQPSIAHKKKNSA